MRTPHTGPRDIHHIPGTQYFTEAELVSQTGYSRDDWWPGVIAKEAIDNALDECEQAGVAPEITIRASAHEIPIQDNGRSVQARMRLNSRSLKCRPEVERNGYWHTEYQRNDKPFRSSWLPGRPFEPLLRGTSLRASRTPETNLSKIGCYQRAACLDLKDNLL